ncbi:MAG: hypothetical protein ACI9UV_000176 [Algoriphagus sp.]|jgi:hypothetical protein
MFYKPVILLSATIKPHPLCIGRTDSKEREEDYYKAVFFYLKQGYPVVFVENSDFESERIKNLGRTNSNFEYITFQSKESHLGKSKGEIEIINHALIHSRLLSQIEYLIKITGRYIISNIDEVLLPTQDISKDVYINPTRNLRWADTRLIMMKKSFFHNYFLPTATKYLDEEKHIFMENIFMRSVLHYLIEGGELNLWPVYPAYQGIDGTHNEKVEFGFFKIWKYNLYYRIKSFIYKHRV